MMGSFSRLNDGTNSNLNVMLNKADDPEKIICLVIQEMEDTLADDRSDAARTFADKNKLQRKINRMASETVEWQRKAALASAITRQQTMPC